MRGLLAPFPGCLLTPSPPTNSVLSPLTLLGAERGRDQKEILQGSQRTLLGAGVVVVVVMLACPGCGLGMTKREENSLLLEKCRHSEESGPFSSAR